MRNLQSMSHCRLREIPVRCYILGLVAVYYIHVALTVLPKFISCFVSTPTLHRFVFAKF